MLKIEYEKAYTDWLLSYWFGSNAFAGLAQELVEALSAPIEILSTEQMSDGSDSIGFFQYQNEIYPVPMSYVTEA